MGERARRRRRRARCRSARPVRRRALRAMSACRSASGCHACVSGCRSCAQSDSRPIPGATPQPIRSQPLRVLASAAARAIARPELIARMRSACCRQNSVHESAAHGSRTTVITKSAWPRRGRAAARIRPSGSSAWGRRAVVAERGHRHVGVERAAQPRSSRRAGPRGRARPARRSGATGGAGCAGLRGPKLAAKRPAAPVHLGSRSGGR